MFNRLSVASSGLDNVDQREEAVNSLKMSPETLIEKYFSGKLLSVPGKQFSYKMPIL